MDKLYTVPAVIPLLYSMMHSSHITKAQMGIYKDVLHDAIIYLKDYEKTIDNSIDICDTIGNAYKFHADEPLSEFDTGYNAAIRDVLMILRKG